ncbi:MAG: hypothetical protein WA946_12315 [Nitrospirota bacterium]
MGSSSLGRAAYREEVQYLHPDTQARITPPSPFKKGLGRVCLGSFW